MGEEQEKSTIQQIVEEKLRERGIDIIHIGMDSNAIMHAREVMLLNHGSGPLVMIGDEYLGELNKELGKVKEILMLIKSLEPIPLAQNYEFIQQKNYSSRRARREEERKNKKKYHGR